MEDAHEVLPVLLAHPAVCADTRVVCTLLRSGRALGAACAAAAAVAPRLVVRLVNDDEMVQFGTWLISHARLVRELHIMIDPSFGAACEPVVAVGLRAAAAVAAAGPGEPPRPLPLRVFTCNVSAGHILCQLASVAGGLTRLALQDEGDDAWRLPREGIDGLMRLTALRALRLPYVARDERVDLIAVVVQLPQLTSLDLTQSCWLDDDEANLLPPRLVELACELRNGQDRDPVRLDHLTRLTSLRFNQGCIDAPLPPKLVELHAGSMVDGALAELPHLQTLVLFHGYDCAAAPLALPALQELSLGSWDGLEKVLPRVTAALTGLSTLRVQRINADEQSALLQAAALRLPGLRELCVKEFGGRDDGERREAELRTALGERLVKVERWLWDPPRWY